MAIKRMVLGFAYGAPAVFVPVIGAAERSSSCAANVGRPVGFAERSSQAAHEMQNVQPRRLVCNYVLLFACWAIPVLLAVVMKNGAERCMPLRWLVMAQEKPLKLFLSYSRKDEELRDFLAEHSALLQRKDVATSWYDHKLPGGSKWQRALDRNIDDADIVLLLDSSSFVASNYCYAAK